MRVYPGNIVQTKDGKVVQVLSKAPGRGQWRCDDGWVHRSDTLRPVTSDQALQHYQAELAREKAVRGSFAAWLFEK